MWINLLENEKALKAIYETSPSLNSIFLHEIMINNHGPSLEIRLDLNEYPASPPIKWKVSKFNTVQVVLELWGLTNLKIDGLFSSDKVDMILAKNEDGISLKINGNFILSANAELVDLKKISAYQNSSES